MAPLIAEYDRHMDEMTEQLQKYQVRNTHTYVEQWNTQSAKLSSRKIEGFKR